MALTNNPRVVLPLAGERFAASVDTTKEQRRADRRKMSKAPSNSISGSLHVNRAVEDAADGDSQKAVPDLAAALPEGEADRAAAAAGKRKGLKRPAVPSHDARHPGPSAATGASLLLAGKHRRAPEVVVFTDPLKKRAPSGRTAGATAKRNFLVRPAMGRDCVLHATSACCTASQSLSSWEPIAAVSLTCDRMPSAFVMVMPCRHAVADNSQDPPAGGFF